MTQKGIFFDLFGTLLIYGDMKAAWTDWFNGLYNTLRDAGLKESRDAVAQRCDGFFSSGQQSHHPEWTLYERRIEAFCLNFDLQPDRALVERAVAESIRNWTKHITRDPEAIPVLQALKRRYTLGLISNYDHPPQAREIIQTNEFESLFDVIVISGEIEIDKPDPRIFHHALNAVNLRPEQAAFVGDSESDDVQGALGVGMQPFWIRRNESRVPFDYRIDNITSDTPEPTVPSSVRIIAKLSDLHDHFAV